MASGIVEKFEACNLKNFWEPREIFSISEIFRKISEGLSNLENFGVSGIFRKFLGKYGAPPEFF